MSKYFKALLFSAMIFVVGLLVFSTASAALDTGLEAAQQQAGLPTNIGPGGASNFAQLIGEVAGIGLSLIGIAFFLLMLYGGIYWMIARGDSARVDKAKEIIEAAIIGVIVVVGAYAIANFLFSSLASGVAGGGGSTTPAGAPAEEGAALPAEEGCCKVNLGDNNWQSIGSVYDSAGCEDKKDQLNGTGFTWSPNPC